MCFLLIFRENFRFVKVCVIYVGSFYILVIFIKFKILLSSGRVVSVNYRSVELFVFVIKVGVIFC